MEVTVYTNTSDVRWRVVTEPLPSKSDWRRIHAFWLGPIFVTIFTGRRR